MTRNNSSCHWYPVCPMKRFTEEGRLDRRWIEAYCLKGNRDFVRFQMEEKGQYHPDNMLPDGTIDPLLPSGPRPR